MRCVPSAAFGPIVIFRSEIDRAPASYKLTKKRVRDLKKLPNIVFFYTFAC